MALKTELNPRLTHNFTINIQKKRYFNEKKYFIRICFKKGVELKTCLQLKKKNIENVKNKMIY